jgi:Uma2 family endonuclease
VVAKSARATYDDLLALPAHRVGELVFGVLHSHPRPGIPHTEAASALGGELFNPFHRGRGGPGGWIILDEPELHLGTEPDVLVPDLAGWRRKRMAKAPDAPFITLAPDWVCEVVSPSTEAFDRADKMTVYAREHVAHAWLVDPTVQTLEVFRLDGDSWRMIKTWRGSATVRAEPFDAIEIELGGLWGT